MRQIKVSYRAVFAQPIGVLNPMGLKLPAPCPVEVFGAGEKWRARELLTAKRQVYEKLSKFASAEHGKQIVAESFAEQLRPWQMWGTIPAIAGQSTTQERMLEPDEIHVCGDGKVLIKEADDLLHIIHAPTLEPGAKIPHAACGARVKAESFISTKANVRPTCKACAEVWEQHYKGKSA